MSTVNIGIVGLGTVGAGVARIIKRRHEDFLRHEGVDLHISRVASRNDKAARELGLASVFTTDWHDVVNDPEVDIVIELIGGTGVALDVVKGAIDTGKHVVTANKAIMATHADEVLGMAREHGVQLECEASVGGGIPIIASLERSLVSNEITSVVGILNGTTNYMLTRMAEDGMSYADALARAQAQGFAEADPTADVDGFDAANKIAILASIAFNTRVTLSDVHSEGIRSISSVDMDNARKMGYTIKLLAVAKRLPQGIDVRVHPAMVPLSHPLSAVNGVYNAIYVVGDSVGDTMLYGQGAGAGPAASAVVGDILEVARRIKEGGRSIGSTTTERLPILDQNDLSARFYIRMRVADEPAALASIADVLATCKVSILTMSQHGAVDGVAEIVFTTHHARIKDVMTSLDVVRTIKSVRGLESVIRIEGVE